MLSTTSDEPEDDGFLQLGVENQASVSTQSQLAALIQSQLLAAAKVQAKTQSKA